LKGSLEKCIRDTSVKSGWSVSRFPYKTGSGVHNGMVALVKIVMKMIYCKGFEEYKGISPVLHEASHWLPAF
jgi:hypothetical protein